MKTKWWAYATIILCTISLSTGLIFWKIGANNITSLNPFELIKNYNLWIGASMYISGALLLTISLRGGDLSVIQPFMSLSYVIIAIISPIIFNEVITNTRFLGITFIILGIIFIGVGSK